MSGVAPDEMVRLRETEIWVFINSGSMMATPPIHILDFALTINTELMTL